MSTHVYNLREIREYYDDFNISFCIQRLKLYLISQKYKVRASRYHIKAHQKGVHVNFRPELLITFRKVDNGVIVEVHHYARIKIALAVALGLLTCGLTALFGVGTISVHLLEAKNFFNRIWQEIELTLHNNKSKILEKTGFDEETTKVEEVKKDVRFEDDVVKEVVVEQRTFETSAVPIPTPFEQSVFTQPHMTVYDSYPNYY